jgi:outer membrane murein-binding lipoprotein Lpp
MTVAVPSDADHDTLVAAVNELGEEVDRLEDENEQLRDDNQQLREELSEVQHDNQQLREELSEVQHELADVRELLDSTRREQAGIRSDVHEVRETVESQDDGEMNSVEPDSEGETPTPQTGNATLHEAVTPLEKVTRLPEGAAESSLSRNQDRARAVFRDVLDYTQSVPKGRAIATPDLRRVLTAFRGSGTACYKTVSRVVDFLTEMGQDDVWTKQRMNGDTVVVFSEEICKRRAAYQNQTPGGDSVVSGDQVAD